MDIVPPSILTIREVILDSCRPLRRLDGSREHAAALPPSPFSSSASLPSPSILFKLLRGDVVVLVRVRSAYSLMLE